MSAFSTPRRTVPNASLSRDAPQRVAVIRAGLAIAWAVGLVLAVGSRVPFTHSDVPVVAAVLLASYPLIDLISSLIGARSAQGAPVRALRINAVIDAAAVTALAITAFGAHAGSALVAFGAWAAVSGAAQFALTVRAGGSRRRQLPMFISGGISVIAGIMFIVASSSHAAHLANLAGYMIFGALLYLVWARFVR